MQNFLCVLLIVLISSHSLLCQVNIDETMLRHKLHRAEELFETTFDNYFDSPEEHDAYLQNITRYPVRNKPFRAYFFHQIIIKYNHYYEGYIYTRRWWKPDLC